MTCSNIEQRVKRSKKKPYLFLTQVHANTRSRTVKLVCPELCPGKQERTATDYKITDNASL